MRYRRRMRLRLLVPALLFASGSGVTAAAADGLTDVLTSVYVESPSLAQARAEVRAADEEVPIALAGRRPSLSTTTTTQLASLQDGGGSRVVETARQSVTLRQNLWTGGATDAALARANAGVGAERARLVLAEQSSFLEAVSAYTAVARDQREVGLARQNTKRLEAQLQASQDRQRFGDLSRTDVAYARTRKAKAVADQAAAEGRLADSAAEFERVVGHAPGTLSMPEPPGDLPTTLAAALDSVETAPAYEAARHDLAGARGAVDVARSALRPRLALEANAGYGQEVAGTGVGQENAAIGATLSVPLYQGGAEYAAVRQAKELARASRHGLDEARRRTGAAIASAFAAYKTATTRIEAMRVQADSAAYAVDSARQEAQSGSRSVIEVLDADQDQFEAEVDLAESERARIVAAYTLRAAMGTLTALRLRLPVALYDPQTNYQDVRQRWFGLGGDVSQR